MPVQKSGEKGEQFEKKKNVEKKRQKNRIGNISMQAREQRKIWVKKSSAF